MHDLILKAAHHIVDKEQTNTIQVEVSRPMAERLDNWSEPVQIHFKDTESGWQMYIRSVARVHEQAVAERASRQ